MLYHLLQCAIIIIIIIINTLRLDVRTAIECRSNDRWDGLHCSPDVRLL